MKSCKKFWTDLGAAAGMPPLPLNSTRRRMYDSLYERRTALKNNLKLIFVSRNISLAVTVAKYSNTWLLLNRV
jgi:hypothetical protein